MSLFMGSYKGYLENNVDLIRSLIEEYPKANFVYGTVLMYQLSSVIDEIDEKVHLKNHSNQNIFRSISSERKQLSEGLTAIDDLLVKLEGNNVEPIENAKFYLVGIRNAIVETLHYAKENSISSCSRSLKKGRKKNYKDMLCEIRQDSTNARTIVANVKYNNIGL